MRLRKKNGQSTAEYAILIGLVVGAALAMQVYVRRGLQGRTKDVVDHTGAAGDVGGQTLEFTSGQYEPYYASSSAQSKTDATKTERLKKEGEVERVVGSEVTDASRQQVIGWQEEDTSAPGYLGGH
ncbi:MAG: hypothetical protein MUF05_06635 [Candidatus Omnitrophica bacterium]|nr:hypothetical protein [Candidatus Omnitrophota bacterium]